MTITAAITPEARIAAYFGVRPVELIDICSYQKVGRAYIVNTDNARYIFDEKGNIVSSEYVPNENRKIIDPKTFDWDELDNM